MKRASWLTDWLAPRVEQAMECKGGWHKKKQSDPAKDGDEGEIKLGDNDLK